MSVHPLDRVSTQLSYTNAKQNRKAADVHRSVGLVRIGFGIAWLVAAILKWQPAFISGFADTVSGTIQGQPAPVQAWLTMWSNLVHLNPPLFAYSAATIESLLALCFILGLFNNTACVLGACWSLFVWSVGEGFGGPYQAGQSTDIGTGFPYLLLCLVFLCIHAGRYWGVDSRLTSKLGRWGFLASGKLRR